MESITYELPGDVRAFLQEKRYLQNVSPQTIVLYESCFKAFKSALEPDQLMGRVVELRERSVSPVTVNTEVTPKKLEPSLETALLLTRHGTVPK